MLAGHVTTSQAHFSIEITVSMCTESKPNSAAFRRLFPGCSSKRRGKLGFTAEELCVIQRQECCRGSTSELCREFRSRRIKHLCGKMSRLGMWRQGARYRWHNMPYSLGPFLCVTKISQLDIKENGVCDPKKFQFLTIQWSLQSTKTPKAGHVICHIIRGEQGARVEELTAKHGSIRR